MGQLWVENMNQKFRITWLDRGSEPTCPPDPNFPLGKDVDASNSSDITCTASLPYPAKRRGVYVVTCATCGIRGAVTTAGRSDDPRSVKFPCQIKTREQ